MKKYILDLRVVEVRHINERYVRLRLTDPNGPLPEMKPGQFVQVRVDNSPSTYLCRRISIHNVDREANELWLLVRLAGEGTRHLALLGAGDTLNVVLPLGNGFTMPAQADEHPLLVGGGVGVAPLLYAGLRMCEMGVEPTFLLGARSKDDLLQMDEFRRVGRVFVTTEDGSEGERGFVTQHSLIYFVFRHTAIGCRALHPHQRVRSQAHDGGCGTFCPPGTGCLRGESREYDGLRTGCLPLLCGGYRRGSRVCVQGRSSI